MSRPVILGNCSLTVGLNENGLVHDFYYPYVGQENLTNSRQTHHKIGIWVNGDFSWTDDGSWSVTVDFDDTSLVSIVKMSNERLGVSLLANDFVDSHYNVLCRRIKITNNTAEEKEVRLFMHQVFQISKAGRGDTALFVPDANYILDYKGRCSLLIYGQSSDGNLFDQYAVGSYGIEGKEGTFRDAEDGELSGSSVEHGGVDSVIRFKSVIAPNQSQSYDYWIVASDSQINAESVHEIILRDGLESRLHKTRKFWQEWLSVAEAGVSKVDDKYKSIVRKSLMIIKAHADKRGGVIASCDSSIYNYGRDYYSYVWPRDGAYALWPLIRLGYREEAVAFFNFCRDIISPDGYLMHKYQPDRAIGSTWHPLIHGRRKELAIQEDETAIVIYMLGEYLRYSDDSEYIGELYPTLITPAANFMAGFIDEDTGLPHASYDLWESKFLTTTYSSAVIYQALLTAAEIATDLGKDEDAEPWAKAAEIIKNNFHKFAPENDNVYAKGFLYEHSGKVSYDSVLDVSSLYGPVMFGVDENDKNENTLNAVIEKLSDKSPSGGVPRFENDNYFRSDPSQTGNPWSVTTLWLAQIYVQKGNLDEAKRLIDWAITRALPSGCMSEQVNPNDGSVLGVAPLVWSHAELINSVLDISK